VADPYDFIRNDDDRHVAVETNDEARTDEFRCKKKGASLQESENTPFAGTRGQLTRWPPKEVEHAPEITCDAHTISKVNDVAGMGWFNVCSIVETFTKASVYTLETELEFPENRSYEERRALLLQGANGTAGRFFPTEGEQSLHLLLSLPCSQMLPPPHSLQTLFTFPCWQMPLPPQSLHLLLSLPCWQMLLPPQSLQSLFRFPCWQMPPPPQSLHWYIRLPCLQRPLPPQYLHKALRRPCWQHAATALGVLLIAAAALAAVLPAAAALAAALG